jgi:hypothetical protein
MPSPPKVSVDILISKISLIIGITCVPNKYCVLRHAQKYAVRNTQYLKTCWTIA